MDNQISLLKNEVDNLKKENKEIKEKLDKVLILNDEKTIRWILSIVKSNL